MVMRSSWVAPSLESLRSAAQALFDEALLALLLAADAVQFGRGVVGQRAVGLDGALDGFG
jgi:hypothetical protein